MNRAMILAATVALCLGAGASFADAPLEPPADYVITTQGAILTGRVAQNDVVVAPQGSDAAPVWIIPQWVQWVAAAPDGRAVLALDAGGNLIGSRDRDQIVATIWSVADGTVTPTPIRLSDLMNPADMPQTASNYAWLCGWTTGGAGWVLSLCDDRTVTIRYPETR